MVNTNTPKLDKQWIFSNIKGMRDSGEWFTYYSFNYDELPPVGITLDDHFIWLLSYPKHHDDHPSTDIQDRLLSIQLQAEVHGLNIPQSFINFFKNSELQARIRSNTDCYFDLSDVIEEIPNLPNHYAIRFLTDSQGCCYWYLVLNKKTNKASDSFVINSANLYGCTEEGTEEMKHLEPEAGVFCAPSFESFIYRFWIENEIWHKLNDETDALNALEQAYVTHYKNKAS